MPSTSIPFAPPDAVPLSPNPASLSGLPPESGHHEQDGVGDKIAGSALSVFHIDDDPLWVELVGESLSAWPEISYLGGSSSGTEGLAQCLEKSPAVVLLDLGLPDVDGFELIREMRQMQNPPKVLLLSACAREATLFRLRQPLIAGMVWKTGRIAASIRPALQVLAAGKNYFAPEVLEAVRDFRRPSDAFFKILSNRELSLLPHFGRGRTNAQIAADVGVTAATIHSHRQNVMGKLNLHRSADLMRWTFEKGFSKRM